MAEPWIRVHANLAGKPIVWRAVEALHVSSHEAIGLLVQFWGAVSQHAKNGEVSPLPDAQIETWAGWRGKRGRFAAFIRAAHLDTDGRVNEWDDYAGALENRRAKERDRLRNKRHGVAQPNADSTQDVATRAPERNETKRNEWIEDVECVREEAGEAGESISVEPSLTALNLTIWANKAVTERWGEQTNPYTQGSSLELADELTKQGVEWQVARLSIYRQCRESKQPRPPRGVNYFRRGIDEEWEREVARRAVKQSGETPPVQATATPNARISNGTRPTVGDQSYAEATAAFDLAYGNGGAQR